MGRVMTDSVHWDWLHGPTDNPDPRVGDMSASAAHRHRAMRGAERLMWDHWLNQPVHDIRADERGDAA